MIHNPLRDHQTDKPGAYCQACQGEIYQEETIYIWAGRAICPDCFQAGVGGLLEASPRLLAQELGVETRKCGEERGERA